MFIRINNHIYKEHDKNFCCNTCRQKYLKSNNYNSNNIDKFIDKKYFNINLVLFKNNMIKIIMNIILNTIILMIL